MVTAGADSAGAEPGARPDRGIFAALRDFFAAEGWSFARLSGRTVLRLPVTSANGGWDCFADAREDDGQLVMYSVCPVAVPEGRRAAVAELLTRANYGLVLGNFELDLDDGEIRYKTSIDLAGQPLTPALAARVAYPNVRAMGRYLPAIRAVVDDGADPQEALAAVR